MIKSGLRFLFGTFTQLIAVIILYEFFWVYKVKNAGMGPANSINAINTCCRIVVG
jgi:hypothetical protein